MECRSETDWDAKSAVAIPHYCSFWLSTAPGGITYLVVCSGIRRCNGMGIVSFQELFLDGEAMYAEELWSKHHGLFDYVRESSALRKL